MLFKDCSICSENKYPILWSDKNFRLCLIDDQNIRGYVRLDIIDHVKEMSQLDDTLRKMMYSIINTTEKILIDVFDPHKINLASLGNITPHIHWHIISRFKDDNFYPNSIWDSKKRNNIFNNSYDEILAIKKQLAEVLD